MSVSSIESNAASGSSVMSSFPTCIVCTDDYYILKSHVACLTYSTSLLFLHALIQYKNLLKYLQCPSKDFIEHLHVQKYIYFFHWPKVEFDI